MKKIINYSIVIIIFVVVLSITTTYGYFYLPFIPRHYDQLSSILNFYDGYYTWKDSVAPFSGFLHSLNMQLTFKGGITQAMGLIVSTVIGPSRYALLLINMLAMTLFLVSVYSFAVKRHSVAISLLLTALCLMGNTFYMPAGGVFDLRWDFVGIMVFSCYVLFLATFVHRNTRASFISIIMLAFLAINVRSITAVFVSVSLAMVFLVFCLLALNQKFRHYALDRVKSIFLVGVITAFLYGIFAVIYWKDIDSYYFNYLRSGENDFRLEEFGVQSGLFNYYFSSTLTFHKDYFAYATSILVILWATWGIKQFRSDPHENQTTKGGASATNNPLNIRWRYEGVLIAIVSALAVLISVAMFGPSPIMPAYMTGACVLFMICIAPPIRVDRVRGQYWWLMLILVSLSVLRIDSMQNWSTSELESHRELTKLYGSVVIDHPNGGVLHFSVKDEAVIPQAFWVWLYESGNSDKRHLFSSTVISLLPLSFNAYVADLLAADIVFKWQSNAPKSYYPSDIQLQGDFGKIAWNKVSAQFIQRQLIPYKNGILGYYIRKFRLIRLIAPYGISGDWFWLGDKRATMTIVSESAAEAYVSAKISRGPSLPSDSKISICLSQNEQHTNCIALDSESQEVKFPVTLMSSENTMQLSVSLSNNVIPMPVLNDTRSLWLRISNIQIRGK